MRAILISILIACLTLGSLSLPAFSQPPRPRPKPPAPKRVPPPPPKVIPPPKAAPPAAPAKEPAPPKKVERGPEFGLSAGYLASIPGAKGEIRFPDPLGLISTDLSLGVMYAQGEDSNSTLRKHALVFIDWCYRLTAPWAPGLKSYIGAGINYDAYTTGRVSGTLGAQAFYGLEGGGPGQGKVFLEVGYAIIRTGFSPDQRGMNILLGFRL